MITEEGIRESPFEGSNDLKIEYNDKYEVETPKLDKKSISQEHEMSHGKVETAKAEAVKEDEKIKGKFEEKSVEKVEEKPVEKVEEKVTIEEKVEEEVIRGCDKKY